MRRKVQPVDREPMRIPGAFPGLDALDLPASLSQDSEEVALSCTDVEEAPGGLWEVACLSLVSCRRMVPALREVGIWVVATDLGRCRPRIEEAQSAFLAADHVPEQVVDAEAIIAQAVEQSGSAASAKIATHGLGHRVSVA